MIYLFNCEDNKEMYLDYSATTPVLPGVIDVISDTMKNIYGNPSSTHKVGILAKKTMDSARKTISDSINCNPEEIIFTSGACEANTLAIDGYLNGKYAKKFITTKIEHKSIELLAKKHSYITEYVGVNKIFETVDLSELKDICENCKRRCCSFLVSIQYANSEIGVIQDIKKIAEIVHEYGGIIHTDATQMFPYKRIDVKELDVDMLSMSGQKIGAPKGIGVLYVKSGIELQPIIYGSQMNYVRGGTENVPYIVGLAKAISSLNYECDDIVHIRDYIKNKLIETYGKNCIVNGVPAFAQVSYLPTNISVSFKYLSGESIMLLLSEKGIYVSTGSACNNGSNTPSSTLKEIGVSEDYINGTIRITLPKSGFDINKANYFLSQLKDVTDFLYSVKDGD